LKRSGIIQGQGQPTIGQTEKYYSARSFSQTGLHGSALKMGAGLAKSRLRLEKPVKAHLHCKMN